MPKYDPRLAELYQTFPQDPSPSLRLQRSVARVLVELTTFRHRLQLKPLRPVYVHEAAAALTYLMGSSDQPLVLVKTSMFAEIDFNAEFTARLQQSLSRVLCSAWAEKQGLARPEQWLLAIETILQLSTSEEQTLQLLRDWAANQPRTVQAKTMGSFNTELKPKTQEPHSEPGGKD